MLPMCEAAAYAGVGNSQLSRAIDALSGGNTRAAADHVREADLNLAAAESRIGEVMRNPGAYGEYIAQLEEALAMSRRLQVTLASGKASGTDVQTQLEQAEAALEDIGPAAGCADLVSPDATGVTSPSEDP